MAAATAAAGPFSTATCTPEYFYLTAIMCVVGSAIRRWSSSSPYEAKQMHECVHMYEMN